MKILYFDCFSGMSGDMAIGALLDAGGDFEGLKEELKKLQIEEEYELKLSKVNKNGITAAKFDVILKNDDHDHDYHHHHRSYNDIVKMIKTAGFSEKIESIALQIFKKIGESEGRIHGVPLEHVHFHEVGAVDSIIDIVGTAILIEQLEIDTILSAPIPVGSGKIRINHGIYPVPAPATIDILKGVPIANTDIRGELTTPTGAAIAAVLATQYGTLPNMTVTEVGYGAGTKTFEKHPNVLRVIIGEDSTHQK